MAEEAKTKEITIIVNTRPKAWAEKMISYEQVVILAEGSYSDDSGIVYTVTYSKGHDDKREGSLVKGQSAKVRDGMIFNESKTARS